MRRGRWTTGESRGHRELRVAVSSWVHRRVAARTHERRRRGAVHALVWRLRGTHRGRWLLRLMGRKSACLVRNYTQMETYAEDGRVIRHWRSRRRLWLAVAVVNLEVANV